MADTPDYLQDDNSQAPEALQANPQGQPPVNININASPNPQPQPQPSATPQSYTGGKTGFEKTMESAVQAHPLLAGPTGEGILSGYATPEQKAQLQAQFFGRQNGISSQPAGQVASVGNPLSAVTPPEGTPEPTSDNVSQNEMPIRSNQQRAMAQPQPMLPTSQPIPQEIAKNPEYAKAYQDYQQAHLKEWAQQDAAFQHDLNNGHITPKAYRDLFSNKDTLGKIGTIFGLMLSGAGSALSRQPNMLLEMMNKEISNDLEAQRASKGNAENFLRINQSGLMNRAQIQSMGLDNAIKANAFTRMQMNRAAYHDLVQKAQDLPLGSPQRAQAEQALAAMAPMIDAQNYNIGDVMSGQLARMKFMMGDQSQGEMTPAQQIRQKQIMGIINPEQSREALKEVGNNENHIQLNQSALDAFDKISKMATIKYKLSNPRQAQERIDAEWNPMIDKLTKDTEGRVTPITVDMMSGLKPKVLDDKETLNLKRDRLNHILNAGFATPTLDSLGVRVQKGEFQGNMVNVLSPNGTPGKIPQSNLQKALQMGYRVSK